MKSRAARVGRGALVGAMLLLWQSSSAQEAPSQSRAAVITPSIPGVVAAGTRAQVVVDGLRGSEGLIPAPDGGLLVSEGRTNRIFRFFVDGSRTAYLEPSNHAGTLAYDARGRLIVAERGSEAARPQLGVQAPTRETLADNFEGHPFTLMNDLVADAKGGVYFTESGAPVQPEAGTNSPRKGYGVYYFSPAGQLVKLDAANITFPSGVILSPDGKILYLNDLHQLSVWAYDVAADGTVRNPRVFTTIKGQPGALPMADGMSIDASGRLYVNTAAGIEIFSSTGQPLGIIPVTPRPQNVVFAGPDRTDLYVLAGASVVYKIPTLTRGFAGRAK